MMCRNKIKIRMGRRLIIIFVNAGETHHDDARRYPPCQGHRQTGRGWNGSSARVLRRLLLLLLLSDRRRWHCQHCSMVLSRIGPGCAGGSGGWWVIGWPLSFQTACFNEEAGLANLRRTTFPFAQRLIWYLHLYFGVSFTFQLHWRAGMKRRW